MEQIDKLLKQKEEEQRNKEHSAGIDYETRQRLNKLKLLTGKSIKQMINDWSLRELEAINKHKRYRK